MEFLRFNALRTNPRFLAVFRGMEEEVSGVNGTGGAMAGKVGTGAPAQTLGALA